MESYEVAIIVILVVIMACCVAISFWYLYMIGKNIVTLIKEKLRERRILRKSTRTL